MAGKIRQGCESFANQMASVAPFTVNSLSVMLFSKQRTNKTAFTGTELEIREGMSTTEQNNNTGTGAKDQLSDFRQHSRADAHSSASHSSQDTSGIRHGAGFNSCFFATSAKKGIYDLMRNEFPGVL